MSDAEFSPLSEPTPSAPVDNPTAAEGVRVFNVTSDPRPPMSEIPPDTPPTPEEYKWMLKTYIMTFVAGCVICASSIGTFIILGVYASWLLMFMAALLCFPVLLGFGYGSINFSRKPLSALLGMGLLVGMFGGVIAGVSFSYYNEVLSSMWTNVTTAQVAVLPIVPVNSTSPQPLPEKDNEALLLFSPPPFVNLNNMWDACIDGCAGYLCAAPIVTSLTQWNITYWAACPYVLDKPCRNQGASFTCDGLWTSNFSSAILSWIAREDYLSFVSAVGDASLTYNLTTIDPILVYWDENPWHWANSFFWLGWAVVSISLVTYFVVMVGCWLSCFHRMRPQLSMPEERTSLLPRLASAGN